MKRLLRGMIMMALLLPAAGGFAEDSQRCPCCGQEVLSGFVAPNAAAPVVAPVSLAGPVAAEAAEMKKKPPRNWKSSVYGGFGAKSGNTVERSYRYGVEFNKKEEDFDRYRLKADGKYRETGDRTTDSKAEASGEMRHMLNERWFAYGTLSALHDDLKDLSYRIKAGPGLGYYFVDTDELTVDISSGPLYVREKNPDGKSGYLAWQFAQGLDWHITSTFRWWASTEVVVDASDVASYTVAFKTGVDNRINEHLSLVVAIEDDYDSTPEEGDIKKNDFEISTGLRYIF